MNKIISIANLHIDTSNLKTREARSKVDEQGYLRSEQYKAKLSQDGHKIEVFALDSNKRTAILEGHSLLKYGLNYNTVSWFDFIGPKTLVSAGATSLKIYDLESARCLHTLELEYCCGIEMGLSLGNNVVVLGNHEDIEVWDCNPDQPKRIPYRLYIQ